MLSPHYDSKFCHFELLLVNDHLTQVSFGTDHLDFLNKEMALLSLKSSSERFSVFLEMILGEEPLPTMAKME